MTECVLCSTVVEKAPLSQGRAVIACSAVIKIATEIHLTISNNLPSCFEGLQVYRKKVQAMRMRDRENAPSISQNMRTEGHLCDHTYHRARVGALSRRSKSSLPDARL